MRLGADVMRTDAEGVFTICERKRDGREEN